MRFCEIKALLYPLTSAYLDGHCMKGSWNVADVVLCDACWPLMPAYFTCKIGWRHSCSEKTGGNVWSPQNKKQNFGPFSVHTVPISLVVIEAAQPPCRVSPHSLACWVLSPCFPPNPPDVPTRRRQLFSLAQRTEQQRQTSHESAFCQRKTILGDISRAHILPVYVFTGSCLF